MVWGCHRAQVADAVIEADCIVMTVADHYDTKDIFGFDRQFKDAGYRRLEPATRP